MLGTENTSSAYQYQPAYDIPAHDKQHNTHHRKEKKSKATKALPKTRMMLTILVCFAVSFVIIFRYTSITEASNTALSLKNELNHMYRVNEQMEVSLDRAINLRNIEQIAKTELGMKRPQHYQIVYVSVPRDDYAQVLQVSAENNGLFGKIEPVIKRLTNVLEYLY